MISPLIADIGFAVAAGVLLSAFINAFLLIPALTVLAGRAAWWPAHPRTPAHAGRARVGRPANTDAVSPWN
jgi:putative drug exporter of the RND superfamily